MGGHLGCSVCVVCHVVSFVFGCSLGPFPGAAQPYSYCRCLVCSCTCLLRVCFPAGRPVCQGVAMCVFANHPCFAAHRPSLFRRVRNGGRPSPSSWVRTSAGLLLSQLGALWCVFRGSFLSGFFSANWFLVLVIVAFHVCPGLPTVALWVSWPVLLRFCVGRSSSPPQCVSHPLLSVLHLARCLSPGAPPRR